jgi:hypothetical protein
MTERERLNKITEAIIGINVTVLKDGVRRFINGTI